MADTLYLKDGTVEVITGTPKESLLALIEDKLGWDCARLFEKLTESDDVDRDEWEIIADGFINLCQSTSEELAGLMEKIDRQGRRMTKRDIREELDIIRDGLVSGL